MMRRLRVKVIYFNLNKSESEMVQIFHIVNLMGGPIRALTYKRGYAHIECPLKMARVSREAQGYGNY